MTRNRILSEFRGMYEAEGTVAIQTYLRWIGMPYANWGDEKPWTVEEITHARKVLSRLAQLHTNTEKAT